jgi:hypothetical protein
MANEVKTLAAEVARLNTALKQQNTAAANAKAIEVTPAAPPAKGASQPRGLSDRLPPEEWDRRRDAQIARRQAGRG